MDRMALDQFLSHYSGFPCHSLFQQCAVSTIGAMKAYVGNRSTDTFILNLGTKGSDWSASRSGSFTSREQSLGTHWIGGGVGLRANLNVL
jgi:hypothetical protein